MTATSHAASRPSPDALHQRLREAAFAPDMLELAREVELGWRSCDDINDLFNLQAKAAVAETYDYWARYADARRALGDLGARCYRALSSEEESDQPSWAVRKRQVWVAIEYAHTLYREAKYMKAQAVLAVCEQALRSREEEAFGTRARLAYAAGQIKRQLRQYDAAIALFQDAMDAAYNRLAIMCETASEQRKAQEIRLAHWTIGKCLALGTGWICCSLGSLSHARSLALAARTLLATTGDRVHLTYADLLLGCVQRAEAARPEGMPSDGALDSAIATLTEARGRMAAADWGHPKYRARAAYELSLAYLYAGDLDAAEERIDEVASYAREQANARWACNALIVRSRIARARGDCHAAIGLAQDAASETEDVQEPLGQIEALIALGEARLAAADRCRQQGVDATGQYQASRDCFVRALDRAAGNRKQLAVCRLHLARVCSRLNDDAAARAHFQVWKDTLEPHVESGFIRGMARSIEEDIERSAFVLRLTDPHDLNYEKWSVVLQQYLLRRAQQEPGVTKTVMANRLGISRPTLDRWLAPGRDEPRDE